MDRAVSAYFGNSTQKRHMEHDSPSEENNSGCVLANLLSQSLAVYVELEKAHRHLRLSVSPRIGKGCTSVHFFGIVEEACYVVGEKRGGTPIASVLTGCRRGTVAGLRWGHD